MIKAQSVSSGCSLQSARCQKHLPREAPSGITGRGFSSPGNWRMTLALRKTVIKGETAHGDYLVLEDGKAIGRIRLCVSDDRAERRSGANPSEGDACDLDHRGRA